MMHGATLLTLQCMVFFSVLGSKNIVFEHKMDVVKVELNSNGEDEPLSSHHQGELSNTNMAALRVTLPVLKAESQENDLVEEIQNEDIQLTWTGDCWSSDNGDADVKSESFEFADVGKVKYEVVEEHMADKKYAQNKEDNSSGQENLPAMGPYFKPVLRNGPYSRSSDGLYICKVCNKSFGDNFNLMMHYRTHTGERPHVCNECGKCFTQFSNLKTHALVHTGERPHLCKECGRSFRRAAHLQKHAVLHTGQRPHVCTVCSKTFVCLTDLKNHTFIHTVDRPHECELCTKTFATPARLRRHRYTHKSSA